MRIAKVSTASSGYFLMPLSSQCFRHQHIGLWDSKVQVLVSGRVQKRLYLLAWPWRRLRCCILILGMTKFGARVASLATLGRMIFSLDIMDLIVGYEGNRLRMLCSVMRGWEVA